MKSVDRRQRLGEQRPLSLRVGELVQLAESSAGMPAGSEGVLLGWYVNTSEALVSFWDGGPLRVPELLLEAADPQ